MSVFDSIGQSFVSGSKSGRAADLRVLFQLLAAVYSPTTIDDARAVLVSLGRDSELVVEALALVERSRGR